MLVSITPVTAYVAVLNRCLVGPRPERPEFTEMIEQKIPFFGLRHTTPPGLTGWAQIKYPYGASVEDSKRKLELDLVYV